MVLIDNPVTIEKDLYSNTERLVGIPAYIDMSDFTGDMDTVIENLIKMRDELKSKTGLTKINIVMETVPVAYSDGEWETEVYFTPGK